MAGKPALVDMDAPTRKKRLMVDHDNATGKIRGLLCNRHNSALGTLGDNVAGLLRAVEYLEMTDG